MAQRLRLLGAISLLVGGALVLLLGRPGGSDLPSRFEVERFPVLRPDDDGFPLIEGRFPVEAVERFGIGRTERPMLAYTALYRDRAGELRHAMIFPSGSKERAVDPGGLGSELDRLRWSAWLDAAQAINRHTPDDALFITWWDNAQRVHLLTGRAGWAGSPHAELFLADHRDFWHRVSGGFAEDPQPLRRLARWLSMDADTALASVKEGVCGDRAAYLLATTDDLARIAEIERAGERALPFETRLFKETGNVHSLIARVKRWAREKGTGSYLVQRLPGAGVRAWRITDPAGETMLLARLLPFTSSLSTSPSDALHLVYRSQWGGYLSIYRLCPSQAADRLLDPGGT